MNVLHGSHLFDCYIRQCSCCHSVQRAAYCCHHWICSPSTKFTVRIALGLLIVNTALCSVQIQTIHNNTVICVRFEHKELQINACSVLFCSTVVHHKLCCVFHSPTATVLIQHCTVLVTKHCCFRVLFVGGRRVPIHSQTGRRLPVCECVAWKSPFRLSYTAVFLLSLCPTGSLLLPSLVLYTQRVITYIVIYSDFSSSD